MIKAYNSTMNLPNYFQHWVTSWI